MADFVQKANVKSSVRELTTPIADIASFDALVQSVITTNPFGCVAYNEGSVAHQPIEKVRESYTARITYQDTGAKTVGNDNLKYNTVAGYTAGVAAILADAANIAAHNGTPSHDPSNDSFSATLRCRAVSGELYNLAFTRDRVTLSSYEDDAIRTTVETWADTVPALA